MEESEKKEEVLVNESASSTEEGMLTTDAPMTETIEEMVDIQEELIEEIPRIRMISHDRLLIDEREYKLLMNYEEGFNIEQLNERYSDVLDKYDYIVGDIGFEQLRLKGFFEDYRKKVGYDQKIGTLEDYLYEYCNFGCAYFVIERLEKLDDKLINTIPAHTKEKRGKVKDVKQQVKNNKNNTTIKNKQTNNRNSNRPKNKKNNQRNNKSTTVGKDKIANPKNKKTSNNPTKPKATNQKKNNQTGKRDFVIRQKDDKK
ncbi:YutD family protein [Vagococcus xieshaowenii]|uniref:DUF1027 domain-containing protein n=1 Tax=Vagococcus xieshaowenii TaxID=2562451 RepID=A0AAJ5EF41_9ENTE|nr:YutD family protein [Vagococcus xieshaowenii]QCA29004.1 DUF1027 domain-containing protein [Vagococcus xieshaowenii]TFZ41021.1 DUF1027 domain-containing protein [Vagococcus xieshaowenii]